MPMTSILMYVSSAKALLNPCKAGDVQPRRTQSLIPTWTSKSYLGQDNLCPEPALSTNSA